MKFCWSSLNVRNLDESIKFYSEIIGLEVTRRFKTEEKEIAFLGNGETEIELMCNGNNKKINVGEDISWGFETENLDEIIKLLNEKNIEIPSGIIQPNPHIKFILINDPDGMKIQIVENM